MDDLKSWKSDTLPELKKRGLLVQMPSGETPLDFYRLIAKYNAKVLRLVDAPGYVGLNKNTFNSVIRPQLNELQLGERIVGFNRSELDNFIDIETNQAQATEHAPWGNQTNKTARRGSSKEVKSGTSTGESATPELEKAFEQAIQNKQSGSTSKK